MAAAGPCCSIATLASDCAACARRRSSLAIAADAKSTDAEKTGAQALSAEITEHTKLLAEQGENYLKARDVLRGIEVYDLIAKEFSAQPQGAQAKARIDEIRKDPVLSKELAAAEAYQKLRDSTAKLSTSKQRDKLKDFADKYKGTKAADRASLLASKS